MSDEPVRAASVEEVRSDGVRVAHVNGHTLALFARGDEIFAVDNRCPHMGFPLHRGTCSDGILTCHWHHARFDLASGGTFDPWADDLRTFPVEIRNGEVWVDTRPQVDAREHQRKRLREGLERNLNLVMAKAVITLTDADGDPLEPVRIGLEFGTRNRLAGWGQGLTILGCMANLLPSLDPEDRPRALYHGVSAVAVEAAGDPPRFPLRPLPGTSDDPAQLKRWLRQFVEVRDSEGAERCIVSAVGSGASEQELADMLFAAATDHRYIQGGHSLDFVNKALETLDRAGWDSAEPVLASLASGLAEAERMEESNAWRHPVDLVEILERAFEQLPAELDESGSWTGRDQLVPLLLGDEPQESVDALLAALDDGAPAEELASAVSYAAALRIARFPTSNEFGDWDTALHTFTFANAVEQGLRRARSVELLRGVFDAAMSIYLDRFLNVPATRLPDAGDGDIDQLPELLDQQQQVNEAGAVVAGYLSSGGDPDRLLAMLGQLLLREDRDFHTIQTVEGAFRQFGRLRGTEEGTHVLVAAARYLAAHSPTVRAEGQTYEIARRLHRGEKIYEEE